MNSISRVHKIIFVFAAISFVVVGSRALQFHSMTRTLGGWSSDHFSHWGSSILFARVGFDSYRFPSKVTCPIRDSPEIREAFAHSPMIDFCMTQNQPPGSRPLAINWPQYPLAYPPGLLLFSAPAATLYNFGILSFRQTSTFTVLQYLLFSLACWGFYSCFLVSLRPRWAEIPLFMALSVTMYLELCHWALEGFYDGAAILMVGLALYCLSAKRALQSVFFYSVALFLHFRALWYLPILFLALKSAIQEKHFLGKVSDKILFSLSVLMLGLSAYTFSLIYPTLQAYPVSNPEYWRVFLGNPSVYLPVATAWFATAVFLAHERAWSVFVLFCWLFVFIACTPEARSWHRLFFLPIFLMPLLGRKEIQKRMTCVLFVFYWIVRARIFGW